MAKEARSGIVTGGTFCIDLNKTIAAWPREDTANEILEVDVLGGGSACNLACDMRKLDPELSVETITLTGDDEYGRFAAAQCDAYGVDRRQMRVTTEAPTPFTDAFCVRGTGKRTHFYIQGSSRLLSPEHFDFDQTRGKILHLGLPGLHQILDAPWGGYANGWMAVLTKARAAGLQTNFELVTIDRDKLAQLIRPCLPLLDLLVVNDFEIGAVAGTITVRDGVTDLPAVIAAAQSVMAAGATQLVVVHFPAGAVVVSRAGAVAAKGSVMMPAGEIVGANGAGDAFAAGFLYGFHQGWDVAAALALAHASAATSMRHVSTSASVAPWREALALADGWGWRTFELPG